MAEYSCPHCSKGFEAEAGPEDIIFCPHCNETVSLPADEELKPGQQLGGFEIIEVLGTGGMGNVYLAKQLSMDRNVALKVLPKILTQDTETIEQFMNEVRMTARMEHQNIVTAIDAGEDGGTYFLAMTYVKGEDLETRIDRIGAIPEKIALKYVLQIADALDYALKKHELIHKDIKPGNIMVNEDADAFLLDMGIAQRIGEINIKEHIEGSPFYMSPEQSRNETLTWSSDQYSLGATLFNMVVGKPPFDDPDIMRIVGMHTDTPVPDPFKINPDVKLSPATVALIKKMLAKKTEGRFASWVEVKKEIRRILKGRKKKKSPVASSVREKTGHMAGPASSGTSRKIPVKKKKNGIQVLLNLSLVIMILLAGGYFGMRFFMESQAHEAIEMAIKNIQKVKSPDELSLKQLELARSKADNFFVGNAVKNEVLKLYTENKKKVVAHIRKKQSFKEDYDNASGVYGRALNYLKRKQLSSAQISCNKALRILRDSNPADDKDAEKKKMFQETVSGLKNKIQSAIRRKLRKIKS